MCGCLECQNYKGCPTSELDTWREEEATICPEDQTFTETIVALRKERDALRVEVARLHEKYDLQLLVVQRERYREALQAVYEFDEESGAVANLPLEVRRKVRAALKYDAQAELCTSMPGDRSFTNSATNTCPDCENLKEWCGKHGSK